MQGRREEEDLLEFIGRFLIERVITLWPGNYDKWVKGKTHNLCGSGYALKGHSHEMDQVFVYMMQSS